jgi:exonuclease III
MIMLRSPKKDAGVITGKDLAKQRRDMNLVTWNILSLNICGAFEKLKNELHKYRVPIAAVTEVRWHGSEIFYSGDFMICYSGNKEQSLFGTGSVIHKNYKLLIMDFQPESDRMCSLRVKGKFFNTTIICTHAPTEEKDEKQKDVFYEPLERLHLKAPKHDIKIAMGDFNAKVGKEHGFAPNVGQYSLHDEKTDNRWRMIDFTMARGMAVSSTLT